MGWLKFRTVGSAVLALLSLGLHCGAAVHFPSSEVKIALMRVNAKLESDPVCSGAFHRLWGVDAAEFLEGASVRMRPEPNGIYGRARSTEPTTIWLSYAMVEFGDVRLLEHIIVHELGHLINYTRKGKLVPMAGEMDVGALMEILCYGRAELRTKLINKDYRKDFCEEREK